MKIHYEGKTIGGKIFDTTFDNGKPAQLELKYFMEGLTDAIVNMPVGSIWEIFIPQEKAFGARSLDRIQPYSMLIFKVQLLSIEKY